MHRAAGLQACVNISMKENTIYPLSQLFSIICLLHAPEFLFLGMERHYRKF